MIKFFRNIRKNLLSQGKTGKYFKYAIGEIILVVIGILIALQINNWNEANKRVDQEEKMLIELLVNLRKDSIDNAINARWYERVEKSAVIINQTLEQRIPWHDSLATHFGNLYTHGISTYNTSAFENLKSIGFNLISNDSIRIALTNLYGISYKLVEKTEDQMSKDNFNAMIAPVLTSRLKMERWFHAVPYNYEALIDDLIFQETVRFRGITMGYVGSNTRDANRRVTNLINMIERELKGK
ncbi:hypothetical protein KXJ69_08085 [Aureisphaera sp. CAU 1614]|uniref:Uncharacterized protein n=1 Tax=Halomarinibacterium sedimenti TaxID=2857106 RepID=A0A9X1FPJ2_9FLAO|nr:DUF6090 family protein [Halomarinibacterium sedimenti]MBW2938062.1 hypothetical protein [Halomarinibacterium sedimenti]